MSKEKKGDQAPGKPSIPTIGEPITTMPAEILNQLTRLFQQLNSDQEKQEKEGQENLTLPKKLK